MERKYYPDCGETLTRAEVFQLTAPQNDRLTGPTRLALDIVDTDEGAVYAATDPATGRLLEVGLLAGEVAP